MRRYGGVLLAALLAAGLRADAGSFKPVEDVRTRFRPEKPSVRMSYNVAYRFLFLRIKNLAKATVWTTEGTWLRRDTGERIPAILVQANIDTPDDLGSNKRGRVSIHRQFTSVMAMPGLDTVFCVKQANEFINPLVREVKQSKYIEIYDLESGTLGYRRKDYLTGQVDTNLSGTFSMAQQGQELAIMLKLASAVYEGKRGMLTYDSNFRISVNIDGVGTPYAVQSEFDQKPLDILGHTIRALRIDMKPAQEAQRRGRPLVLWTASLHDIARLTGRRRLVRAAPDAPDWSMVPLVADYGLVIGYVRLHLTDVGVEGNDE
jgi:hypothetical protein